ncbi:MAG: TonB-dependent receptor [Bacteroidota bacterium]
MKKKLLDGFGKSQVMVLFFYLIIGNYQAYSKTNVSNSSKATMNQKILEKKISLDVRLESIESVLEMIEDQSDVTFIYSKSKLPVENKISYSVNSGNLKEVLADILFPNQITYGISKQKVVLKKVKKMTKLNKVALTGTVKGVTMDADGNPLSYAQIQVQGTSQGTVSGADGRFKFNLPEGKYMLEINYVGYKMQPVEVEVVANSIVEVMVEMEEDVTRLDGMTVYGRLTRGQAKALNNQKTSLNIKNVVDAEQFLRYPDVSAAETVQRLPGISITRDQGEGEFVQIRGVSEQLNALTVNGQRLPSVEPDAGRAVGLDLVQSYLIETITVTKALTPDQDADAIGGMVDFKLREAKGEQELEIYAGGGFNEQESEIRTFDRDIISIAAVGAKRFFDDKLGVLVAGSYFNTDRGSILESQRFENIPENILSRRRTLDYDVRRRRFGIVGNIDFIPAPGHKLTVTTNFNGYEDDEIRRQARYTFDNNREERRIRNRVEDQNLNFYQLRGEHQIGKVKLDYDGSYGVGSEDLPDRTEFRFRRTNPALGNLTRQEQADLGATTTFGVDEPHVLTRFDFDPRFTEEKNYNGTLNISVPLSAQEKSSMKFGFRYRRLEREFREAGLDADFPDDAEPVTTGEGEFGFADVRFTDPFFSTIGFPLTANDIVLSEILDGFDASETVLAGYVMNTTNWTDRLTSVVGVRLENTSTDYVSLGEEQLDGEGDYINILPSVHLTYRLDDRNQFRAAYSTGLSRPNYSTLAPFESVGDDQINRGNPDLEAITANSFDIMYERYTNRLGFLSFGLFAKLIENQIVSGQVGFDDDEGLPVISPTNGAEARVLGIETAINQNLSFINAGIFKWLTVNANYTFTDSEADFGDERDDLPLTNSPKHTANLSFLYDNPELGLSAVIGGVYRHFIFNKFEDADGDDIDEDIWLDETFHLDFSIVYRVAKSLNLKLQVNNLTNQANTEVNGRPNRTFSRLHESESYGRWAVLGLEFKL